MIDRKLVAWLTAVTVLAGCTEPCNPCVFGVPPVPPARYGRVGLDILVADPRDSAPPGGTGATLSGYLDTGVLANGAFRRVADDTLSVGAIVLANPTAFSSGQYQYVSREPITAGSRPVVIRLPAVEGLPRISPFLWGLRGRLDPDTIDVATGNDPVLHLTPELPFTPAATFHGWNAEFVAESGTATASGSTELTFPWRIDRASLPPSPAGLVTVRLTTWVGRSDATDPPDDTYNVYLRIGQSFRWVLRLH